VKKIAHFIPISQEMLDAYDAPNLLNLVSGDLTDEQRAEHQRRREQREAEQRRQLSEHVHRMVFATGLRRAILELHAPREEDSYACPVCRGCDADGYDWEPPEWPCRSYALARDGVA